jgi:hypothetical protein
MAVKKSKSKTNVKSKKMKAKAKPVAKKKSVVKAKAKSVRKPVAKAKTKNKAVAKKSKSVVKKNRVAKMNKTIATKPVMKSLEKLPTQTMEEVTRQMMTQAIPAKQRSAAPVVRRVVRSEPAIRTATQFTFMKAPAAEHAFEVGDNVEVFCDHEKSRERIRGWIKGIVVQVDNKMVAVQFRSNVFLTDGWMVPDRILWYPLNSEHIRPAPGKKATVKKELIPDY